MRKLYSTINNSLWFKLTFLLGVAFNLLFCSWYVLHHDIVFISDIARDFFLFAEISQKKLMLIGPRSSVTGLFHGPLWAYLNYPAYLSGKGNPIAVGWFWIIFISLTMLGNFFVAKALFSTTTAYLYIFFFSLLMIFYANALYNPFGALFLLPSFFFTIVRYTQTQKAKYLTLCVLICGLIIQFQMAVGIPFLLLLSIYVLFFTIKHKKPIHILTFLIIIIPLTSFIFFDLRHHFEQLHAALAYLFQHQKNDNIFTLAHLKDRVILTISGIQLLPAYANVWFFFSTMLFLIMISSIIFQIKTKRYQTTYLLFLYFYFGYILLSFINRGPVLDHQIIPLMALTSLIFVSLSTSKSPKVFYLIFFFVCATNYLGVLNYLNNAKQTMGQKYNSWKLLSQVSQKVYQSQDNNFGYFVYTPDTIGYGPKYAMKYYASHSQKTSYYFQKKPVTYLLIEPPPADNPYIQDTWWKKNKLHLNKKPAQTFTFAGGYKLERYILTKSEIAVPTDPNIDPGLTFR